MSSTDALRITTHTGLSLEGELELVRVMIEQLSRFEGAYAFQGNWWNMERDEDGTITVSVRFQPDPDLATELDAKRHAFSSKESSTL